MVSILDGFEERKSERLIQRNDIELQDYFKVNGVQIYLAKE